MRFVDLPILELSEAFGRRGLSLAHLDGNELLLIDVTGPQPEQKAKFTSWQIGEYLSKGASVTAAVDRVLEELGLSSKPAPKKPKSYVAAPGMTTPEASV